MSTPKEIRLARLLRWREDKLAKSHRVTDLPSRYDLQLLSAVVDFAESPLLNNEVIKRWRDELFTVWSYLAPDEAEDPDPALSVTTTRPAVRGTQGAALPAPAAPAAPAVQITDAAPTVQVTPPASRKGDGRPPSVRPAPAGGTAGEPGSGGRPAEQGRASGGAPAPSRPERPAAPPHRFEPCHLPVWDDVEADPIVMENRGAETMLSWPPADSEGYLVYRVTVGRDVFEPTPERGRQVGPVNTPYLPIGEVLTPTDRPVQWVRVWANTGVDRAAAEQSQPRLVAQEGFVTAPTEASCYVAGRQVMLRWTVPAGLLDVELYRRRVGDPPEDAVLVQSGLRSEYREDRHELGSWEYWICAVAEVRGQRPYSQVTPVSVTVTVPLENVPDLRCEQEPGGTFRLEWRQPESGRVTVHVTERKVDPSLQGEVRAEGAVTQADPALAPHGNAVLPHTVRRLDGVEWLEGVGLELNRVGKYLTPVLRRDGEALVGQSVFVPAVLPLRDLRVHERVDVRLLTFALPSSAKAVCVYMTRPGESLAEDAGHLLEMDAREYWRSGRVVLPDLGTDRACTIHVRPVFEHHPQRRLGPAASVDYPGLVSIAYRLVSVPSDPTLGPAPSPRARLLQAVNRSATSVTARFTISHQLTRLPLSADDGPSLLLPGGARSSGSVPLPAAVGGERGQTVSVCWVDLPPRGFVRAFVAHLNAGSTAMPVALLDPDLEMLRCPG